MCRCHLKLFPSSLCPFTLFVCEKHVQKTFVLPRLTGTIGDRYEAKNNQKSTLARGRSLKHTYPNEYARRSIVVCVALNCLYLQK